MPEENHIYYTYGLANPLKLSKESYIGGISLHEYEFFYFGYSGREERIDEHLKCYKSDKNINKKKIISEIQNAGEDVIIVKLIENVNKQTAISKEIKMISYYGREDLGLGPLTNKTNGGDGGSGGTTGIEPYNKLKLKGKIFSRLAVLENVKNDTSTGSKWLCICECGTEKIIIGKDLVNGKILSCGCLRREKIGETLTTHGMSKTPEFNAWKSIFQRCYNLKNNDYELYGGNGIKLGDRWKDSFENFYGDMGDRPSDKHVLGRINKDRDFEKSNCKWMTRKELNTSGGNVKTITIDGKTRTMVEWSLISGVKRGTICARIRIYGWSPKEAVFGRPTN